MRNYLGRVIRDIERKISTKKELCSLFSDFLQLSKKIYSQKKNDKNKLYSLHEPDTLCISKGKAHKRYEFGCKVGLVTTNKEGFVLSSMAFSKNIYDGHSLSHSLTDAETNAKIKIKKCFVDKGYKGHNVGENAQVFICGTRRKMSFSEKKQLKRRGAIEATIGHMKSDGLLSKSYLKGTKGNQINAILCGIGHNIRLILKKLTLFLFRIFYFYICKIKDTKQNTKIPFFKVDYLVKMLT